MRHAHGFSYATLILLSGLVFVSLLLGACAGKGVKSAAQPYADGQLVLPGGSPATEGDFLRLAASADYILVGERHDSALDHSMQALLLRSLAKEGKKPLLGLEMLPRKRHDVALASFSLGETNIEALPAAVDWQRNWGFDFNLYKPVFEVVRQYAVPVHGLNIPNDLRKSVSAKGLSGLSRAEKKEMPRTIVPPLPEQREKLWAFFQTHYAMLASRRTGPASPSGAAVKTEPAVLRHPGKKAGPSAGMAGLEPHKTAMRAAFERFLLIQSLWDSTMAEAAAVIRQDYGGARPMVILAGGGHVEHGYGIAARLKLFDPAASSLLVMPFSGPVPEAGAAQLYYFSPRPEEKNMAAMAGAAPGRGRLGLSLEQAGNGLRVLAVVPASRAEKAGLRAGDVLVRADSMTLASAADMHKAALNAKRNGRKFSIGLLRQGEAIGVVIPDADQGNVD